MTRLDCTECGKSNVEVHPPKGRWLIDPSLFVEQNPTEIPLGYNVMLTEEGTKLARCDCGVSFEVSWDIAWSPIHDAKGTPARYLMAAPEPFMECPSCNHHWRKTSEGFMPTSIDGSNPCLRCVKRCREIGGERLFG